VDWVDLVDGVDWVDLVDGVDFVDLVDSGLGGLGGRCGLGAGGLGLQGAAGFRRRCRGEPP